MTKTLVVVESPAKAKTIKKYLGPNYTVLASKGHVKDLPKKLGVDVEHDFTETYEIVATKEKVVKELRAAAKTVDEIVLATDPDREGEAIAFHVADVLGRPKSKTQRVEFHEITKRGVTHGIEHPRKLNNDLYDAQRARRVLDRLVGYDVSALVWSKLAFGLSAGRVQSVALRLIVEREQEIAAFVPEEYWNVSTSLQAEGKPPVVAKLTSLNGKKLGVSNAEQAATIRADLEAATYSVSKVTKRQQKRSTPAPYTTSKLQQDGTSYLRFTAKRTMKIAQGLYEGVNLKKDGGQVGLITYMRTDSVRVSADAIEEVRAHIAATFGKDMVPDKPNEYKARKLAQEAHEAIRPTSMEFSPEKVRKHLKDEQYRLYKMIWDRFVASQMKPALYDQTGIDITAKAPVSNGESKDYGLRLSGRVLKFAGWLDAYRGEEQKPTRLAGEEENGDGSDKPGREDGPVDAGDTLPPLSKGEVLTLVTPPGVVTDQKFTQPRPRFNEGSLVRELEKRGIGRPSTYAEIIGKVQARAYVEKLAGGQLKPTELGSMVIHGLVESHLDFMDPGFTAKMEEELDEVERGKMDRVTLLRNFYTRFHEQLTSAKKNKRWAPEPEPTEYKCQECGAVMLKRWSRNGWFLGCSNYPKCKFTMDMSEVDGTAPPVRETDYKCDECGAPMVIKTGRYGEFLACSTYPKCKFTRPVPLGVPCPKCGGDIIEVRPKRRGGRSFYGCTNYNNEQAPCDFKVWQRPVVEKCPQCGSPYLLLGGNKDKRMLVCPNKKECGFKKPYEPEAEATSDSQPQPPAVSVAK